ncbi:MAG: tetratricopeptide repeat protein, partial [Cyanobacteria bacterium HKST-UBA02]|nr:tetratricopeptide repeat protein [Cyanobacteria bacterium HKST-UBA02]
EKSDHESSSEMAMVLNQRGLIASEKGDYTEALAILEKGMTMSREHGKEPSADLAELINNIGLALWRQGDDASALPRYEEALAMRKELFGEMNKDYAETLDNIGVLNQRCNDFDKAEKAHRRSLAIREQCLGPDHPEVGYSCLNLAETLKHLNQTGEYENMYRRTIDIWKNSFGANHPNIATALSNLGLYLMNQGHLKKAKDNFQQSLDIRKELFGKDSSRLIISVNNLAIVNERLGLSEEAEAMANESTRLMKAHIAEHGEKDAQMVIMLADSLNHRGKKQEAQELLERAEKAAAEEWGEGSMRVAKLLQFRANLLFDDETARARDLYSKVLKLEIAELGKNHAKVAETRRMLAACYTREGDTTVAGLLNMQARAIEFPLGIEDPEEALYSMLLHSSEDVRGDTDKSVMQTKKLMATMLKGQGKTEEADALLAEYLAFMEEEEGDSIDLADELFMLAADASLESNFEKAIAWLEQSLAIRESLEESEFDDINMTYSTLINSYVGAEMLEEARSVTEKWLGLVEKEHGSGSWRARAPIGQLIVVYDKTGDTEQHRIWSQRMEALPEPSAMEQTSMLNFESGIIGRSLRRSLEGLGGFMQLAAESVGEGGEGDQASGSQDE